MLQKERFEWVWMSALIVVLGVYFIYVLLTRAADVQPSFLSRIGVLAAALTTLALIASGGAILSFIRRGGKPHTKPDERDRLIEFRSSKTAYQVLLAGMIIVGCVMPFNKSGWEIVNAALLAIAIAEVTRSGLILRGYRRGFRV